MSSLCVTCKYKMDTWSEELRKHHDGCGALLDESLKIIDEEQVVKAIKSDLLGFGWVTNSRMAFNDQIITQRVYSCDFYKEKY